jgi:hypothetical protein
VLPSETTFVKAVPEKHRSKLKELHETQKTVRKKCRYFEVKLAGTCSNYQVFEKLELLSGKE